MPHGNNDKKLRNGFFLCLPPMPPGNSNHAERMWYVGSSERWKRESHRSKNTSLTSVVITGGESALDISAFNEFVELAKRLNITETARMLNMSQPTLSKHIISFEKELRLSLFERTGSAMRLTEAGNALLPFAYKILDAQSMFYEEARRIKSEAPARLSVTGLTDETAVMALLGRFITSAENEYGTGFIQVRSCHHKRPIDFVKAGSIDVAFDYFEPSELDDDTVGAVIVGRCPWAAIVDAGHPFAGRASIDIEDLRHETLVRIEGAHVSEAWRFIERACLLNGFAPKTRRRYSMRLTDLLTLSSTIGNDVLIAGVNFVKRIEAGLPSSCRVIELTGEATSFPLSALYHIGNLNPALDRFVDFMEADLAEREHC